MEALTIKDHEEFLRTKSKKVDFKKDDCKQDIEALEEYCLEHKVLAMASVQIGIQKRIIYIKNTDLNNLEDERLNERRILINSVIVKREGLTQYWEACASCLNNMGLVLRPYKIEVEYIDEFGKKQRDTYQGFESTVFSHEYDHLDGILHIDIAEEVLQMEREDRIEFRKTHGYEIFSETGDYQKLLEEKRKEQ